MLKFEIVLIVDRFRCQKKIFSFCHCKRVTSHQKKGGKCKKETTPSGQNCVNFENPFRNLTQLETHNTVHTMGAQSDLSFSVLWSPLPPITWIIPFIGHLGIADSDGVASDFQGPYYVGDRGRMAFGEPTRALKIDVRDIAGA